MCVTLKRVTRRRTVVRMASAFVAFEQIELLADRAGDAFLGLVDAVGGHAQRFGDRFHASLSRQLEG